MGRWAYFRAPFAGTLTFTAGGAAGFSLQIVNPIQGADPLTIYMLESVVTLTNVGGTTGRSTGRLLGAMATKHLRHGQALNDIPRVINAPQDEANEMPLGHWRMAEWRNPYVSDTYGDRSWAMPISHRKDLRLLEGESLVVKAQFDTSIASTITFLANAVWMGRYRYLQSGASASLHHDPAQHFLGSFDGAEHEVP